MFKGSITALITPFEGGKVDEVRFQDLVARQVAGGSHGVVPCGTTGEAPCLTPDEHERVVTLTVEAVAGRIPVIVGAGTNYTEKTIALVRRSEAAGADGLYARAEPREQPAPLGGRWKAHYDIDRAISLHPEIKKQIKKFVKGREMEFVADEGRLGELSQWDFSERPTRFTLVFEYPEIGRRNTDHSQGDGQPLI